MPGSAADQAATELTALLQRMEVPCAIVETPTHGKFVKALAPIPSGTVIFEEKPIVAWPLHGNDGQLQSNAFCGNCFSTSVAKSSVKCEQCNARYCGEECRRAAAATHAFLCGAEEILSSFHAEQAQRSEDKIPAPISAEAIGRCVAAMAARFVRLSAGNPGVGEAELFDYAAHSFNRLLEPPTGSDFEDIDAALWCRTVRELLKGKVTAAVGARVAEGMLCDETLRTLLGELSINAQGLFVAPSNDGERAVEAAGVFTLQSCFNHSCVPNAAVAFGKDCDIGIKALRDIAEGDEITISYLPALVLELESAAQRRARLQSYFFTCQCPRCSAEDTAAEPPTTTATTSNSDE